MNKKIQKLLHNEAMTYCHSICPVEADHKAWEKRKEFKMLYRTYKNARTFGHAQGFQSAVKYTIDYLNKNNMTDAANFLCERFERVIEKNDERQSKQNEG